MKNKWRGVILILLLFAAMSLGSGNRSDDSSSSVKEITSSEKEEVKSDTDTGTAIAEDSNKDTSEKVEAVETPTIEEQILIDDGGYKVTAKGYTTDKIWGDGIDILIENDTDKDIGLSCTALIVNDYMISDMFSSTTAAGKKSNEKISLSDSQLKAAGIENVGKIEIYLHTFAPDTYMTIKEYDCVTIETSMFSRMDTTADTSGHELYNEGGVKIIGRYVDEESFWGAAVVMYIENSCDKNIVVTCDDVSVNGFMVSSSFYSSVFQGKKAIDSIQFFSSDLEANGIESVDDIELKFRISDDNYNTIAETDVISFSAK